MLTVYTVPSLPPCLPSSLSHLFRYDYQGNLLSTGGAFAEGLLGAREKGEAATRHARIQRVIAAITQRTLARMFNAWVAWVEQGGGAHNVSLLKSHVKWQHGGLNSLLDGSLQLAQEQQLQQMALQQGAFAKQERSFTRHPLRAVGRSVSAAKEKLEEAWEERREKQQQQKQQQQLVALPSLSPPHRTR